MLDFLRKKKKVLPAQSIFALFPAIRSDELDFYAGYVRIKLGEIDENPGIAFISEELAKQFLYRVNEECTIVPLTSDVIEKSGIKKVFLFETQNQIQLHLEKQPKYMKNLEKQVYSLRLAGKEWIAGR